MKKIFAIITLVVISLVGLAQNNTVVWANGELIQDAVADSLFLYENEWADTIHLLIPKIVVREVHKTVYIHDTVYIESSGSSDNTETSGMENGHEWVDLGLSVKWATCNVGAIQPEEFGDYFAWGEVETKAIYYWSTYKYGSNWDAMTKYSTDSYYGIVDNKTVLDPEDDAATANWGGNWRMPTKAEQDELKNNCEWEWITLNGVGGYKVIGPNGNFTITFNPSPDGERKASCTSRLWSATRSSCNARTDASSPTWSKSKHINPEWRTRYSLWRWVNVPEKVTKGNYRCLNPLCASL